MLRANKEKNHSNTIEISKKNDDLTSSKDNEKITLPAIEKGGSGDSMCANDMWFH